MLDNKLFVYFIVFVIIFGHFCLGFDTINNLAPTYDEPLHLTAGYSYLKTGRYYLNVYDHPPFAEMFSAIPLIFMKPILLTQHPTWERYQQYSFANLFLYHNRVDSEKMLNSGRIMMLLLSCVLSLAIFFWSKELYGLSSGILSIFLYCFSSAFISHGSLVTTDLPLTLFYFLSLYSFYKLLKEQRIIYAAFTGISLGFALTSKFSAVIVPGIYLILLVVYWRKFSIKFDKLFLSVAVLSIFCFVVLLFVYQFNSINLYFEGLFRTFKRLSMGRSTFLFGNYSTTGWWYYFIYTFLIKTPIPFLLILLISGIKSLPEPVLVIPCLIYFFFASISKVQIGFRHILPIFPFLIVISSSVVSTDSNKNNTKPPILNFILLPLIGWYIFGCMKIHPFHLSYFNEFVGGAKNGYKYLTDSNIDWGQGLKKLGKWFLKQKYKGIYLCYFGTADPHYYNIKYIGIGFVDNLSYDERPGDNIQFTKDEPVIFAISVTNLQATYYADKKIFAFLKEIQPIEEIAYSIFVYDITKNPKALRKLAEIFASTGNFKQSEFLYKRAMQFESSIHKF